MATGILAPQTLRNALARLDHYDVTLPPAVLDALAELDRVEGLRPPATEEHDLVDAYRDPTLKAAQLAAVAARILADATMRRAWDQARNGAAQAGVRCLAEHAADILEALRPTAERHIATLVWYAEHDAPDVATLVNAGKMGDAQKAAAVPSAHSEWGSLTTLRANITRPLSFEAWGRGGTWTHPERVRAATTARSLTGLDLIVVGIKAGGVMHWPTMDQAAKVAERDNDAERAAFLSDRALSPSV